ncbi:HSP70-domain-containing protein [Ascodesmis nigricans]|uniref:HSP70-domain-containing protein n=1 Tax=Ascodesmis nigricans TaxID=341454 RepID=A0A4S2MR23_9PEZI|nr:HSP70-domain-containing protein [Ascodesmis nigricans]
MSENPEVNVAEAEATPITIGISFGNSNSSIAFTSPDGKAEVIANEDGDRQIPSVLSYLTGDEFHGQEARNQLVRNAENTVAYFRDFLGKSFAEIDPTHSHASAHPVDADGKPAFKVKEKDNAPASTLSVNEITSRHLRRLVTSAADFLGKPVKSAVVTVPTDFSEAQRAALIKSAKAADLEILQTIHEPVAAVLSYSAKENHQPEDKTILVCDLGGTRCDTAIVAVRGGMYTILATAHDYELGGFKLDEVLVEHFAKEFIKKHKSDPRTNSRALAKLKLESEAVKRTLSIATSAPLAVDSLHDGHDFHSTINRLRFEMLSKKVFDDIVKLAEHTVQKAELDLLDIDTVILSGGTSHIPKIATRLAQIFPVGTAIHAPATDTAALNPSELSAKGAAIQAALIQEFDTEDIHQSEHPGVTVAPHLAAAIGVVVSPSADEAEGFHILLHPSTALPARGKAEFTVSADGDVVVKIAEAERYIHVTKPEPVEKPAKEEKDEDEDEDSDEESDEEEEEEKREKKWKVKGVLAEARLQGVKKEDKVEVTVNAAVDGGLNIAARVVGTQNGVRGVIKPSA